jgi:hypothetical protein
MRKSSHTMEKEGWRKLKMTGNNNYVCNSRSANVFVVLVCFKVIWQIVIECTISKFDVVASFTYEYAKIVFFFFFLFWIPGKTAYFYFVGTIIIIDYAMSV